ncbi:hypothetical protein ACFE04_003564 [Oxalis oulophora]
MGKYIPNKKPKSLKETITSSSSSSTSCCGVRTRAKTLALQRQQLNPLCYLQLRSRRLQKPSFKAVNKPLKQPHKEEKEEEEVKGQFGQSGEIEGVYEKGIIVINQIEGSCGDNNNLDFQNRDHIHRNSKESTPCSSAVNHQEVRNDTQRHGPTSLELEEFFSNAEKQNRRLFIEKYNFDIANDSPLPGRYEWAKLSP